MDLKQLQRMLKLRNTFGDKITVTDEILVWQGKKLLFKQKGHIVNYGLIGLIDILAAGSSIQAPSYNWGTNGTIRLGTDTVTPTGGATTALTAEINTAPNTHSGATANPASNQYRVAWIATWNAGTISGTIGEMALKLYIQNTLLAFGASFSASANTLFSRLSVADGDFTAFTINTSVPLTIEWRLLLTFA